MEIYNRIDHFISNQKLIKISDPLLIAVSGGMDSMFLLHYLIQKKYTMAVAHCNFGLRNEESEGDMDFVKSYCQNLGIKCHIIKFDTLSVSQSEGISIQMAARDLRYRWFNELCEAHQYTKIVTAHHKTDQLETILLNQIRGTGIKGLMGMAAVSGNIIRPLLCINRSEIKKLIKILKLPYREDSSNNSDHYFRNRLRLKVLPQLRKINPDVEQTFYENSEIMRQSEIFIRFYLDKIKSEIISESKGHWSLDIDKLLEKPEPEFILFQILNEYGFNASQVSDIYNALHQVSGKQFFSKKFRVLKNRSNLNIEHIKNLEVEIYEIKKDTLSITTAHHQWTFEIFDKVENIKFVPDVAHLDFNKLDFPLTIRLWQKGDKIIPIGMIGQKKISDILIDHKISILDKEKIWVVLSKETIVWVGGLKTHNDYKISSNTEKVFKIELG